jgi:gliding motility-associated lipoprotein GldH
MKKILLAIVSLLLLACQREVVYSDFVSLPAAGWHSDSAVVFHIQPTDSLLSCQLVITLRHTDAYDYQNLWMFVELLSDSLLLRRDTVNAILADDQGQWLGSGLFLKQLPLVYLEDCYLPSDSCQLRIQHAMRTPNLRGISDIGLKISKNTQDGKE